MSISFNVTGDRRKALVKAISEILEIDAVYNGAPSFSYTVGVYVIDRHGAVTCPDHCSHTFAARLVDELKERGFAAELPEGVDTEAAAWAEGEMRRMQLEAENVPDYSDRGPYGGDSIPDYHDLQLSEREELGLGRDRCDPPGENGPHPSDAPDTDPSSCEVDDADTLTILMPVEGFTETSLENLKAIIASKDRLIKKALGTDSLHFYRLGSELRFPWFTITGTDGEMDAYVRFVTALCKMAKEQKRIVAKEREEENEKLAMRLFLVRLGFVGPELKVARAILLRNLTGNSAWKSGTPPTRATAAPVSVATQMIPYIGGTQDEKQ